MTRPLETCQKRGMSCETSAATMFDSTPRPGVVYDGSTAAHASSRCSRSRHSTLFRASSCRHGCQARNFSRLVDPRTTGTMIGTWPQQSARRVVYDHRLRELVRSTQDISGAVQHGVPPSTARGWLKVLSEARRCVLAAVAWPTSAASPSSSVNSHNQPSALCWTGTSKPSDAAVSRCRRPAIRSEAEVCDEVCQVPWASQTNSTVATSRRSPRIQGWCCLVLETDRVPPQNSCVPNSDPRVFDYSRQTTRKCRGSEYVNVLLPNAVVDWVGDAVVPGNRTDKSQIIRACVRWKTVNRA